MIHWLKSRRALALIGCAALAACGSATGAAVPNATLGANASRPHFSAEILTIHFTNKLDKYVWLTPKWSTKIDPNWHNEGVGCVLPGQTIVTHLSWTTVLAGPEAKIQIEAKKGKTCDSETISYGNPESDVCHVQFEGDSNDADASINAYYDNGYRLSAWSGGKPHEETCP